MISATTQNYITGCPKFCLKTEIRLKMNGTYSVEMSNDDGKLSACSYGFKTSEDSLFVMNIMISTSMVLSILDALGYF
ncbi:hypothetical protein AYB33_08015 [Leptospira santarosai]|nr:Uncharacterized protein XB17_01369 [Leptospira santarosai]KXZ25949.1 hypothetical protein AYB33_08015 [Leptospira santarosai]